MLDAYSPHELTTPLVCGAVPLGSRDEILRAFGQVGGELRQSARRRRNGPPGRALMIPISAADTDMIIAGLLLFVIGKLKIKKVETWKSKQVPSGQDPLDSFHLFQSHGIRFLQFTFRRSLGTESRECRETSVFVVFPSPDENNLLGS